MPRAVWLLVVVLLAAGACGGDDEDPAERTGTGGGAADAAEPTRTSGNATDRPEPTRTTEDAASYRRKVNRLCREDERLAKRLTDDVKGPEDIAPYFRRALTYARKRRPLYEALKPPRELRDEHAQSVALDRRTEDRFAKLVRRLEATDDPITEFQRELPGIAALIEDGNRLARKIGVTDCIAEGLTPGTAPQEDTS